MLFIGSLLNSKAQTEILRALCLLSTPVGLRELSRLTRQHPHSVERVLEALKEEGLVIRKPNSGKSAEIILNPSHRATDRLKTVFETDQHAELQTRTASLHERGKWICSFVEEAHTVMASARSSRHDLN